MNNVEILGVKVSSVKMDEAVKIADSFFNGGIHTVFTPNPEIIMLAQKDKNLMRILNGADLLLPDGIGVIIGSRIIKNPLPERVAGFDFVCRLFESGRSFYLFGSKPGIAEAAAVKLREKGVNVVGTHHGYFDDDSEIINDINDKKPDILLVCLGAPKQEKWIDKNKEKLNVSLCVGVGGTLDVISGNVKRAPVFFQKTGLEWLYRAVRQPSRIIRLAVIPKFLLDIIRSK